jgi:DNA-binding beta-propeller fold protein YncE
MSPDGRSLYYGSQNGFVAVLARSRATGGLDQLPIPWACVGNEFAAGCRLFRGVELIDALAVTPDGRNVYVGTYGDGLLAVLARKPDGKLVQLRGEAGCLLGQEGSPVPLYGPYGCRRARLDDEVSAFAPSPDGKHLYVASGYFPDYGGVYIFSRHRSP